MVIPILPSRDLDDVVPFYAALGFEVTYRQARPNPYAALRRGPIDLHFFGLPEFDPKQSLGSVIIQVPDTVALYEEFAAGLRAAYGRLPVKGLPRITRPRRKQGTGAGFTVVDPGGNWLRISSTSDDADVPETGGALRRVIENAARQADAHGDERRAIGVLDAGLARHADAPDADRLPALVYLAELLGRTGEVARAREVLAAVRGLGPDAATSVAVGEIEESLGEG